MGVAAGDLVASLAQEDWDIVQADNAEAAGRAASAEAVVVCGVREPGAALRLPRSLERPSLAVVSSCEAAEEALSAGYDDVLVPPYEPRELQLRVRNLVRAAERASMRVGAFVVNPASRQVWRWAQNWIEEVEPTPLEFDLLLYLVRNAERAVGYDELLTRVWSCDYTEGSNGAVRACVKRLRRKIESDASQPLYLLTVRGVGYRWAVPPTPPPAMLREKSG